MSIPQSAPGLGPGPLDRRRAGVLLHPTSLPGPGLGGDLGPEAHRFLELLRRGGLSVWQVLPLGPTHADGSPYLAQSVRAGNPALISLELVAACAWAPPASALETGSGEHTVSSRHQVFGQCAERFAALADTGEREAYAAFRQRQSDWLEDYALYQVLRSAAGDRAWWHWPESLRDRESNALASARRSHRLALEAVRFEQFLFYQQWQALRRAANTGGVLMFGDLPLFVAHDSADVWAEPAAFRLGPDGLPTVVAGVPPDAFSATGQHWGNPHYDWVYHRRNDFAWWRRRLATELERCDLLRLDHFRGLQACWEIPADCDTALEGCWVPAPGAELLAAARAHLGALPLVAEDLGVITPEVLALRDRFQLPGMKILQFAFDSDASNPYLPHNLEPNSVIYTGTHDNDTSAGWWAALPEERRARVLEYLGCGSAPMPEALMRCAMGTVSRLAILPMQDLLGLDSSHRMNVPGTAEGNWRWRLRWEQVDPGLSEQLHHWAELYGRVAPD